MTYRTGLAILVCAALGSCGGGDGGTKEPAGPYFVLDLPADASAPIPLNAIPYPNDAFLGADGHLAITAAQLPFPADADPSIMTHAAAALSERKGFGLMTGAIFPVAKVTADDPIDPATLTPAIATLVDLGDGTTTFPLEVVIRKDGSLYLGPKLGQLLEEGHDYAYVIRAGVKTTHGVALAADPDLAALLGSASPSGATSRIAARYAKLRAYLAAQQIDPATVVAASEFTTSVITPELVAAREILDAQAPATATVDGVFHAGAELDGLLGTPADDNQPGSDNPGGIAHAHIEGVVLGHFSAVSFTTAEPKKLGAWTIGADGKPMVKGMQDVPFLLVIPKLAAPASYANLPILVFNHGFGGSRAAVMYLANTLAGQGFAVIGIDLPSHGDRFHAAKDTHHNFTGGIGADGLADEDGQNTQLDYLDVIGDSSIGVAPLDPPVMTASFRQSACDIMSEVRLVASGDWSALATDFPSLSFDVDRLVYSGQSLGGFLGTIATTIDPKIGAAVLGVAGGGLVQYATENSPWLWQTFGTILSGAVANVDYEPGVLPPHTDYSFLIMQQLVEDADPLVYARHTILEPLGTPKHIALITSFSDEIVPNQSSEALAQVMGLPWMPTAASMGERYIDPRPTVQAPVSANLAAGGTMVTAAFVMLTPATHGVQTQLHDGSSYLPGFPPFVNRNPKITIDNPIVQVQTMTATFARTYVDTGVPTLVDPF